MPDYPVVPLTSFEIRDYEDNRICIDLDMSSSLIKEISINEHCGDQTLVITLADGTDHHIHAGSFHGGKDIPVYKDGTFLEEPSELYRKDFE